jgi:4a-hydroxytetrahydrobiopterin dehydratase
MPFSVGPSVPRGGKRIPEAAAPPVEREPRFRNFREALTFVQEIGELAEAERHHPNISFGWGNATVSLQTKKIKGLHENDFIMATKIDRIFARTVAG